MATRGLYCPDGGGRDLYMCDHIPIPFQQIGKGKAPKFNSPFLGTRTDPLPRYSPDGSGRDLFNIRVRDDKKKEKMEGEGIFSRKIPDKLQRKNKISREEARRIKESQDIHSAKLSKSKERESIGRKSPPRSPKRSDLQHFSGLIVNKEVLKKLLNKESKWR